MGAPGDYAASIGTTGSDLPTRLPDGASIAPNGVFEAYKGVRVARITDGLSNTILVGEKHIPFDKLEWFPWDCSIYDGHNPVCNTRAAGPGFPLANSVWDYGWKFGSYHPGLCQFVFCDGSVHVLRNGISEMILGLLAHKSDGQILPKYDD